MTGCRELERYSRFFSFKPQDLVAADKFETDELK